MVYLVYRVLSCFKMIITVVLPIQGCTPRVNTGIPCYQRFLSGKSLACTKSFLSLVWTLYMLKTGKKPLLALGNGMTPN